MDLIKEKFGIVEPNVIVDDFANYLYIAGKQISCISRYVPQM